MNSDLKQAFIKKIIYLCMFFKNIDSHKDNYTSTHTHTHTYTYIYIYIEKNRSSNFKFDIQVFKISYKYALHSFRI